MAGSSSTILVRILGDNGSLQRALAQSGVALAGLQRITQGITSTMRAATIAVAAFSAATIGAGLIGAAALAGFPALLIGIGIAAAAQSERVRSAFSDLKNHVVSVMKDIAAPLVEPLVRGAGTIRRAFDLIAPSLARIFAQAAPVLDRMFAALIPLARQLGPLLEEAFGAGVPVLMAFVRGLTPLTEGLRGFFAELGANNGAFASFVATLMSGLGQLLPALGALIAGLVTTGQAIVGALMPALSSIATFLGANVGPAFQLVTGFLAEHATALQVVIGAIVGLLAVVKVIEFVTAAWAGLVAVFTLVTGPVGLTIAAIAALTAGLVIAYRESESFRALLLDVAATFQDTALPAARALGSYIIGTFAPAVADTARKVGSNLRPVWTAFAATMRDDVLPAVRRATETIREAWPEIQKLAERIGNATAKALELYSALVGKLGPAEIKLAGDIAGVVIPAIATQIAIVVKLANAYLDFVSVMAKFYRAIASKVQAVLDLMRSLPGKITSALGDLGGLLSAAGSALIGGFISGITSRIGDVESTLRGLTGKLTSWKGPPEKDATLLQRAGQLIMEGFIRGIRDGIPGVKDVLGEVSDLVTKVMDKRFKNDKKAAEAVRRVLAGLRDERLALLANADAHDRVMDKLDAARDKLRALKDAAKGYAEAAKSAAIGFANITTSGVGTVTQNANTILAGLGQRLQLIKEFRDGLARLREMGLNQTSFDQIAQAGVEGGIDTIRALLAGTQGTLDAINNIQGQINDAAGDLGAETSDVMFGGAIEAASALVDQLKSKASEIAQIGVTMADAFLDALRAAGINVGPGGAGLGIVPPAAGNAIAFQPTASRATNVNITVNAPVGSSAADIGREIQRNLEAYFAAGGRALVTS